MNSNAQLVVDSLGHVGIGTEAPKSRLAIGGNGGSLNLVHINRTILDKGFKLKMGGKLKILNE